MKKIECLIFNIFLVVGSFIILLGIIISIISKVYFLLLISLFGLIFFLIGFSYHFNNMMYKRKLNLLKKTGKKLLTDYEYNLVNVHYYVNGVNPVKVVTSYIDDGEIYTFYSRNLWIDEDATFKDDIVVYVNINNYQDYVMDINSLKENK